MKKTTIIVLAIIILIAIVIGIMYVIDTTRILKNKEAIFSTWGYTVNEPKEIKNGSKDIPKEDKIIFNDNGGKMACIEYDCKAKEFNVNQEILENFKIPEGMKVQRVLGVYIPNRDVDAHKYNILHDISISFANENKAITITAAINEEPFTDYAKLSGDPEYKKSVINEKKVELFRVDATKTINKAMYQNAIFEYNDVHFVVETKNITEEEFLTFVKSIFEIDMKSYIEKKSKEQQFIGTVLEETTKYMIVEPNEDEDERKSADKIIVSFGTDHKDYLYGIGRKVLITYNGEIKETYPAQISSDEISTEGYPGFYLYSDEKQQTPKRTKVLNNQDIYENNSNYDLYYYGFENIYVNINNEEDLKLEDALKQGKVTLDAIIAKANKDLDNRVIEGNMYDDGGTTIYKYPKLTIIKSHTLEGDRDVYIGIPEMTMEVRNK